MLREPFLKLSLSPRTPEMDTALTADYTALVGWHQSTSVPVRPRHMRPVETLPQSFLAAYV
jgi:hypothetical protein